MQEHLISYVILHLRLCSSLILYQSACLSINSVWVWGGCGGRGVAKLGSEASLDRDRQRMTAKQIMEQTARLKEREPLAGEEGNPVAETRQPPSDKLSREPATRGVKGGF